MEQKPDHVDLVGAFESCVWERDYPRAVRHLDEIFAVLARTGGLFAPEHAAVLAGRSTIDPALEATATRLAAAIAELFGDRLFQLDEATFRRFLLHQRWLNVIFSSSGFRNADFVLRRLGFGDVKAALETAPIEDLFKIALLYGPESELPFDFVTLFRRSPPLACALGIAMLSHRLLASPRAHEKREVLVKWLAEALERLDRIDGLPREILVDAWMHCSYADTRDKHDLKRPLNALIRRQLAQLGYSDPAFEPVEGRRPTVLVILEWFRKSHSIMRTHSISMRALKEHFRLVGLGPAGMVDEVGQEVFDDYHELGQIDGGLSFIAPVLDVVNRERPSAVYYPSVGMGLHSLFLINLRLAPAQVMGLGHPATSHSDKIDYVVVEEDYLGDPSLFSEKVVPVPRDAIPYIEPAMPDFEPIARRPGDPIRIAVPASVMKLNPGFLGACRQVQEQASARVEFHFMLGGGIGLAHAHAIKVITGQLPGAQAHHHCPYPQYMRWVDACDLFANPFPFGNTNSIVDTVMAGLPGVCLSGDEVHSHIDEGIFLRIGLPEWTIARTVDEYVAALLRLIDDTELRLELSRQLRGNRPDRVLYSGRPEAFASAFVELLNANGPTMGEDGSVSISARLG